MRSTPSLFLRKLILALATLSPLGCGLSHGAPPGPARAVAAASKPPSQFEPIPPAQLPNHYNPHDLRGKVICQGCHGVDGGLLASPDETCLRCHRNSRDGHPVAVVQAIAPAGLPLLPGGLITCHTCHDPHSGMKEDGLRLDYDALCMRCHKRH